MYPTQKLSEGPALRRFATLGKQEDYAQKLHYLAHLTAPEAWDLTDYAYHHSYATLYHYILYTFHYGQETVRINENKTHAFFNTGLLSKNHQPILIHFIPSSFYQSPEDPYWYLKGFVEVHHPDVTRYAAQDIPLNDYSFIYPHIPMDTRKDVLIDFEHIYIDHIDRLPFQFKKQPQATAQLLFESYKNQALEQLKRQYRLSCISLHQDKVNHLLPLRTVDDEIIIIALEEINQTYVAKTILTPAMAYNNVRILGPVDVPWLLEAVRKG